jgi:hypothetical protein
VVLTPLKILVNISQLGLLFPIYGKIKNVPNHQPGMEWDGKGISGGKWVEVDKQKLGTSINGW